jgi:hypothetical protein
LNEEEAARTLVELRARLCEDSATILQLSRIVRGECKFRGLGVCEKTGSLCIDGLKFEVCKVFKEAKEK